CRGLREGCGRTARGAAAGASPRSGVSRWSGVGWDHGGAGAAPAPPSRPEHGRRQILPPGRDGGKTGHPSVPVTRAVREVSYPYPRPRPAPLPAPGGRFRPSALLEVVVLARPFAFPRPMGVASLALVLTAATAGAQERVD